VRDLPGVRIDAGFADGSRVSPYYDAMLAKLIVRGDTRTDAIRLLRRVLAEVSVFGLRTNARFLRDLLATPEFAEARMHTGSLDHWLVEARPLFVRPLPSAALWALAFALRCGAGCTPTLRSGSASELALSLSCEGTLTSARVSQEGVRVRVRIAASEHVVQIHSVGEREVAYTLDGLRARCALFVERDAVHLAADGSVFVFREPSALRGADTARDSRRVQAPMAGTLARVLTEPGRLVAEGDVLCVVEAMKMEVRVLAARAGVVVAVHRAPGDQVTADELLAEIGDAPEPLTEAEKT